MFKSIIKISVLLILLSSFFVQASDLQIENMIREGLKLSYDFQMKSAENVFTNLIKKYPNDARGYHYKSTIYLWNFLGNNDKKDYEKFLSYSESAIEKAEASTVDAVNSYILGASYGYRAIAFGKADKYLDMIWASKKSNTFLTRSIELDDQNYDAYLGLGLFKFALSRVPASFKWALGAIGFNGDQNEGLRYLQIAADKGEFSKVEAKFYLAQIRGEYFNDYELSSKMLGQLIQSYPRNLLFLYTAAVLNLKDRNLISAEKYLTRIITEKNVQFKQILSYSNFLLGDVYFRRNNFEKAKDYYIKFLSSNTDKSYMGIGYYRLALCHELLNERPSAKMYFQHCTEGDQNIDDDIFARRKGEVFANRILSNIEKDLVRFSNLVESANYKPAIDSLLELFNTAENGIIKFEAAYWLSEAYFGVKQYDETINYATLATQLKEGNESWIHPFAYFNLARASFMLGNNKGFKDNIEKVSSFSNYDNESKLKSLVSGFLAKKDE